MTLPSLITATARPAHFESFKTCCAKDSNPSRDCRESVWANATDMPAHNVRQTADRRSTAVEQDIRNSLSRGVSETSVSVHRIFGFWNTRYDLSRDILGEAIPGRNVRFYRTCSDGEKVQPAMRYSTGMRNVAIVFAALCSA